MVLKSNIVVVGKYCAESCLFPTNLRKIFTQTRRRASPEVESRFAFYCTHARTHATACVRPVIYCITSQDLSTLVLRQKKSKERGWMASEAAEQRQPRCPGTSKLHTCDLSKGPEGSPSSHFMLISIACAPMCMWTQGLHLVRSTLPLLYG